MPYGVIVPYAGEGCAGIYFLEGQAVFSRTKLSNNRSVMPLDVRGHTCATMTVSASMGSLLERAG